LGYWRTKLPQMATVSRRHITQACTRTAEMIEKYGKS
jgi:hypothetical protein